ncbi:hypothetical protein [Sphingomonas profundi]|uniref:hypothetical protein n=1 Tax=Alterirhizorhabdus profundi TaxID=2681549 RepID=UPI0012E86332|nr:hypothetical protein [Sphingomonas profundi]
MALNVNDPRRIVVAAGLAAFAAGCSSAPAPLDDSDKIVRATIRLLASEANTVCVDRTTSGKPLEIFANMASGPPEVRHLVGWSPPRPLGAPVQQVSRGDALTPMSTRLAEPGGDGARLPPLEQFRLNGAARALMRQRVLDAVTVRPEWAPRVVARPWLVNRFDPGCAPRYVVSPPVRAREFAFVTVKADHWGVTYALSPVAGDWRPVAEWSRWLY